MLKVHLISQAVTMIVTKCATPSPNSLTSRFHCKKLRELARSKMLARDKPNENDLSLPGLEVITVIRGCWRMTP